MDDLPENLTAGRRYDVLDQNGDVMASFDVWWMASYYLLSWETSTILGNIRDNETGELQLEREEV